MDMRLFIRALLRWWFVPLVTLAIALAGVWLYHRVRDTNDAAATVAILQTYFPPPGEYVAPQIGFDTLADSQELHARIAHDLADGTTADQIKGKLSITYQPKLNQPNPSPVYKVAVTDSDRQRAIHIANVAVVEARKLYGEINTPDATDVRQAFQPEVAAAQAKVDAARNALVQFESANNAYALTQRRDQELTLIAQLRAAQISARAAVPASSASGGAALVAARAQLDKLTSLEPQYDRVAFNLGLAQADINRLTQRVSDLQIAGPGASRQLADARSQLAAAQDNFNTALIDLYNFQQANGVSQLPAAIQSQMSLVNQLTVSDATTRAGAGALDAAVASEQAELQRLLRLQPQFDQLNLDLVTAQGQRTSLEQRILDIQLGRTLPAEAQVKVLQDATIQSSLLMTLLTYALGVFLAVFVSLTTVYLLAYFEKLPPSIQELEQALGRPVIIRVPTGST